MQKALQDVVQGQDVMAQLLKTFEAMEDVLANELKDMKT